MVRVCCLAGCEDDKFSRANTAQMLPMKLIIIANKNTRENLLRDIDKLIRVDTFRSW